MGCAVGGECIAQPAGVRRGCVGERKCSGRACRCVGWAKSFGGGERRSSAGNASALRGRVSALRGRAEVLGKGVSLCVGGSRSSAGNGLCGRRGLTHFRRSRSRVRVLLYIRPPRHRCEIAAMGPKDAPCEHPSPAKTSAPAPSAFIFPPRRSHFPRMAFGDAHEDFGLPQQQLSTMGYPRKSYPHRCSPPCAKRARPRACARVYIIYRSPVGRSRGVSVPLWGRVCVVVVPWPASPSAGWGRARVKADAPSRSAEPCRLCAESLCVKAEVHQANPAPARAFSPRQLVYGRAPARLWAKCRAQGGGGRRQRRTPPRAATRPRPPTASPPPPKWAPRLRRREGKRPNGAPPHRNAHTPNAERKRYLHNSRTKTQRRTKRCAQFVIFVFTPCKLLHNFSTVLHRSPRNVPKRA